MSSTNQQQPSQTHPRISAPNTAIAQIVVGPKAKRFQVPLNAIVHYSPFFQAAFTGSFKEAQEKVVTLSDTQAGIFELFVNWLYRQRFPTEADSPQLLALYRRGKDSSFQFDRLVRVYVFSDKYDVPKLKRQCLDALFNHFTDEDALPDVNDAVYAVKNLNDQDPLLLMIIDNFCYWGESALWNVYSIQKLPIPFIARIMSQLSEFRHGGRDSVDQPDMCDYHDHASREERQVCEDRREKAAQAQEMMQD